MGGHIEVESQLEAGSTFWFELPMAVVEKETRFAAVQIV